MPHRKPPVERVVPLPRRELIAFGFFAAIPLAVGFFLPSFVLIAGIIDAALIIYTAIDLLMLMRHPLPEVRLSGQTYASLSRQFELELTVENTGEHALLVEARLPLPADWSASAEDHHLELAAGDSGIHRVTCRAFARNRFTFDRAFLRISTRHSLFSLIVQRKVKHQVSVIPDVQGLNETIVLLERDRLNQLGIHKHQMVGSGSEIAGLREYSLDDDARWIDWRVSTRVQRPVVRTFQNETGGLITLLVDCGRQLASEEASVTALDYAINSTLMLAGVVARSGDALQLIAFRDQVVAHLPATRGRGVTAKVGRFAAALQPQPVEANYRLALEYALRSTRRSSMIMLLTDLTDDSHTQELAEWFARVRVRHQPLLALLRNPRLFSEALLEGTEVQDEYRSAAARDMVMAREDAIAVLRANGTPVIDTLPSEISPRVISAYLRHRAKQTLMGLQ